MAEPVNILCTICARGGSKGVKNKNLRPIAGKPLIVHTIAQARATGMFEYVAVSSDSDMILDVARDCGVDLLVRRPDEMAHDSAPKAPAIRHCVEKAEAHFDRRFDVLVDLDATSPLRLPKDIVGAVRLLERSDASNVITAAPARRSPYFNLVEVGPNGVVELSKPMNRQITRRQDSPKCYDMNASVYVWQHDALFRDPVVFQKDTVLYEMPEERSIDIDSELDFQIVEMLLLRRAPDDSEKS